MFLDSSLLVDKKKIENIEEDITCPICQGVINDPYFCNKCQNNFCQNCIKKWESKNKECPFRCKKPEYIPNRFLSKIFSELLKFKCEKDCDKIIPYKDVNNHYKNCKKEDFKEKYYECATEMEILKVQMENYKDIENELDEIKEKNNDLENELDEIKEKNNDLENELDEIKEKNNDLQYQLDNANQRNNDLENELDDIKEKNDDLENELDDIKEKNDYLENELDDIKEKNEGLINRNNYLEKTVNELENDKKKLENLIKSLENKNNELKIIDYFKNNNDVPNNLQRINNILEYKKKKKKKKNKKGRKKNVNNIKNDKDEEIIQNNNKTDDK